jgi:hypothetical protein
MNNPLIQVFVGVISNSCYWWIQLLGVEPSHAAIIDPFFDGQFMGTPQFSTIYPVAI